MTLIFLTFPSTTKANDEPEEPNTPEETEEEAEAEAEGTGDADEEAAEEKAEEAEEEAEEGQELKCKKPILETYGMVGLDDAKPMALDMCESITHSCCSVTDQLKIYENWIEGGEDADLLDRFKYHTRVRYEITKGV